MPATWIIQRSLLSTTRAPPVVGFVNSLFYYAYYVALGRQPCTSRTKSEFPRSKATAAAAVAEPSSRSAVQRDETKRQSLFKEQQALFPKRNGECSGLFRSLTNNGAAFNSFSLYLLSTKRSVCTALRSKQILMASPPPTAPHFGSN